MIKAKNFGKIIIIFSTFTLTCFKTNFILYCLAGVELLSLLEIDFYAFGSLLSSLTPKFLNIGYQNCSGQAIFISDSEISDDLSRI